MISRSLEARASARRRRLARLVTGAIAVVAVLFASVMLPEPAGAAGLVRYVSPSGSDSGLGTAASPWRHVGFALQALRAGDTLYVGGGTYVENVNVSASLMHAGTATAPITVKAHPGERPVIQGLLWLTNPSYWVLDGINVTWNSANSAGDHMVKVRGGTGWRFTNAELWGAHSYAALLVGVGASGFRVDHNFIHDTYASNSPNQDHLIYVDNGATGGGVIERNVLARSVNGRGVKLGPGTLSDPGTSNIVIRYNTFFDNQGPSNVQLSGSSSNNQIYGNLLDTSGSGVTNVTGWNLTGTNNVVRANLGWRSSGVADFSQYSNGGGNTMFDPRLANPAGNDFTPTAVAALAYGITAPGDTTTPPPPITTAPPIGYIDAVTPRPGAVAVQGWALDPDGASPIDVHLYVDGTGYRLTASGSRPDIGAAFPGYGSEHGFAAVLPAAAGWHTVCAYAINDGIGGNSLLGCVRTVVGGSPRGALDLARQVPGGVEVSGWALDPDTAGGIDVHAYAASVGVPTPANRDRADIAWLFPPWGGSHGYGATIPTTADGPTLVCAYGIDAAGADANSLLGCRLLQLVQSPLGRIDAIGRVGGQVQVDGWAIDPTSAASIDVHVYASSGSAIATTASVDRPDVAAALPGYGAAHGFRVTLAAAPGAHVCAYGINVGAGGNSLLGCGIAP